MIAMNYLDLLLVYVLQELAPLCVSVFCLRYCFKKVIHSLRKVKLRHTYIELMNDYVQLIGLVGSVLMINCVGDEIRMQTLKYVKHMQSN